MDRIKRTYPLEPELVRMLDGIRAAKRIPKEEAINKLLEITRFLLSPEGKEVLDDVLDAIEDQEILLFFENITI